MVVEAKAEDFLIWCERCNRNHVPYTCHCPKCGSPPSKHVVENYDMMWHDGDVICKELQSDGNFCDTRVRGYDAG